MIVLGEEVKIFGSIPISPNDGIDLKSFPTAMDGTPRILQLLTKWGPGCFMSKAGRAMSGIACFWLSDGL